MCYAALGIVEGIVNGEKARKMKPGWFLLAASVISLLAVCPAAALSQPATVDAGCGTATIDGHARPIEWTNAGKVGLFPDIAGATEVGNPVTLPNAQVSPAQKVSGELWVMNDTSHLYMAVSLSLDQAKLHPDWWTGLVLAMFTDEGDPLDGQWDASACGPPLPGEGLVKTYEKGPEIPSIELEVFFPWSELGHCSSQPLVGVQRKVQPGTPMVFEQAFDLSSSELDKVRPGDCFRFGLQFDAWGCERGSGCAGEGNWLAGSARWPELFDYTPATLGEICLDPCEPEFVPEPGTILLFGSGLTGLAAYATLRRRARA